ncbi:MAG TPA: hypothetical protein VMZ69_09785, partial [Saprospiraceae bacterium]|nr:hypothetical protein [Saprospiraceae bacterium]
MNRVTLIIFLFIGISTLAISQKQNNIWYFGNNAGLSFNTQSPTPLSGNLNTLEGTASISDPAGHLLFYTNGVSVWDRNHNVMPNGSGLLGGESSSQSALIVPLPNSCNQYYLFATEDHNTNGGLTYSIIDMCLNNGFGDIVSTNKNILLSDITAEKITAVLHTNGVDIWIITHRLNSAEFLAYLLSDSGLNTTPVISSIGSFYPSNAHIGPAKASHNGTKLVSVSTFHDICEMFDFDKSTGKISNFYDINQLFGGQQWMYGVEFSPNDSLLYLSTTYVTNYLYQINLETKDVITLNTAPGNYVYGALQMGPDKKIYMARNNSDFLDVIHQPDLPGNDCVYEEGGLTLYSGTLSTLGLPNFVPYSFFKVSNSITGLGNDTTICSGNSIELKMELPQNCADNYLWSDGTTGAKNIINQAGIYWVEVEEGCLNFRDTIQITTKICQPECSNLIGAVYGSSDVDERAYCIVATL